MPRVLIVDDHRNTRETLAMGLSLHGCTTRTAASADEAISGLRSGEYDCLVCDLRMPGRSGIELLREVRGKGLRLSVVLMTAYDVTAAEAQVIEALDGRLFIKPVTSDTLAAILEPRVAREGLP